MAENVKKVAESNGNEVATVRSQLMMGDGAPKTMTCNDERSNENNTSVKCIKEDEIQQKEQELPELIRHKGESKGMTPCMPYINLSELTTILRDPSMPSKKILNEVADKIMLKSEESESDDGSVSSGGGVVGMKGLLDCIFEVSYMHEDSASSDDDDSFKKFPREIPCNFCNKIFGSTMTWNTHVLVAHAQQDSSVLNIRRLSTNEADQKDKSHPQKKYTRGTSKSDCDAKDTKVHYISASDKKHNNSSPHSENAPVRKRHSSFSKTQSKDNMTGKTVHKHPSAACLNLKKESPANDNNIASSCDLAAGHEETERIVSKNDAVQSVCADPSLVEADNYSEGPVKKKCRESLLENRDEETQGTVTSCLDQSCQNRTDDTEKQQNIDTVQDTHDVPAIASTIDTNLHEPGPSGRKRKSTTPQESASFSPSPSNPKCSKKKTEKNAVSTSEHGQSDISPTEVTSRDGHLRKRTSKAVTMSSRRR